MSKSRKNRKSARNNKKLLALRAQAALDRAEFFANGGDLSQWRGRASVTVDKKKQRDKRSCRGKKWQK